MNRALGLFVGFCFLLAGASALVVWWMGPHLAGLAFDSERARQPYFAVFLQHADDASGAFQQRFEQLLIAPASQLQANEAKPQPQGATVAWRSAQLSVVSGGVADEWSTLLVAEFATARQFVRLLTGPQYRAMRKRAPQGRQVVVGTSDFMLAPFTQPAAILMLARNQDPAALETWLAAVRAQGGELLWDASAIVLEGATETNDEWNRLLVVAFASAQALQAWAFGLDAQTANALLKAKSSRLNIWVVQQQGQTE